VTSGYWQRPDETAAMYCDGWFHTGDLGVMDVDGYLKVVDRKKEMIITGGANIYPTEVERVLESNDKIAQAALVGVPDSVYGEVACAVVVLRPGCSATAEEVIGHCRERLARFKCPRSVRFRDALPLTATGKIARRQLRALMQAG
jgi:long-chain acyl-CoA synthetase